MQPCSSIISFSKGVALYLHNDYIFLLLQIIAVNSNQEREEKGKREKSPPHFYIAVLFLCFPFPVPKASRSEVVPSLLGTDAALF